MSEENVEVVRRAFEAFGRGDLDATVENVDADVVMRPPETWETVMGGRGTWTRRGETAVRRLQARVKVVALEANV